MGSPIRPLPSIRPPLSPNVPAGLAVCSCHGTRSLHLRCSQALCRNSYRAKLPCCPGLPSPIRDSFIFHPLSNCLSLPFSSAPSTGFYCSEGTGMDWQPCPPGTYGFELGLNSLAECQACDGGKFCPRANATEAGGQCWEGFFCTRGSTRPNPEAGTEGIPCMPTSWTSTRHLGCSDSPTFSLVNSGSLTLLSCPA